MPEATATHPSSRTSTSSTSVICTHAQRPAVSGKDADEGVAMMQGSWIKCRQ